MLSAHNLDIYVCYVNHVARRKVFCHGTSLRAAVCHDFVSNAFVVFVSHCNTVDKLAELCELSSVLA